MIIESINIGSTYFIKERDVWISLLYNIIDINNIYGNRVKYGDLKRAV